MRLFLFKKRGFGMKKKFHVSCCKLFLLFTLFTSLAWADSSPEQTGDDVPVKYAISIATVANGMVKSDKASASVGEKVILTAYPSLNHMMSNISVRDNSSNSDLIVSGGWYSWHKVTFFMPASDVTVTPKFTKDLSAEGGLYIDMEPGRTTVDVSKKVKSFYVYDNGGKDVNYRSFSNDTLVLKVTEGYRMRLTGTMVAENLWDLLRVYDGENTDAPLLFGASGFVSGVETDIGDTVVSSGETMMIGFKSDGSDNYAGYALKVTVEQARYAVTVNPVSGGEVYVKDADTLGAVVYLTAAGAESNRLSGVQVTDRNGNTVISPVYDFERSKFIMPNRDVFVTATFTSDISADGGLHLDMVMGGNETVNVPEDIKSFKLYDNGGANADYEKRSSDTLTITAPKGSYLSVTGSLHTEQGSYDRLFIVDGSAIEADTLFSGICSTSKAIDIGEIVSSGRSLTFYFKSDGVFQNSGFDLTVNVLKHLPTFAAVKLIEDERGLGVAVDGNYNGDDTVMITDSIQVDFVEYGRTFSTSGFSTIVLPFDVNTSKVSGLKKVAAFSEIKTNDAGRLVAVMSLVWKDSVGVPDTTLKANTPYMVLMNGTSLTVEGGVTLVPTVEPVVKYGTWEFRGTLAKKVWAAGDSDLGRVYGFSAEERPEQNIKIGQFVKAGAGARIRPGRAYLINVPERQSNHVGAGRPAIAALPSVVLPEDMDVSIEDKEDGSTTFIGRFNTRTGEFVNMKAHTYDLKGRNVNGSKAKGMFIRK